MKKTNISKYVVLTVLIAFALVTIFMTSSVLFDWFGIRAREGNYVTFIVQTNLTAGLLYLFAAYGLIFEKKWAFWAMVSVALLLVFAFALFALHIHSGGPYENRTIGAMIFRILFTLILAGFMYGRINRKV